MNLVTIKSVGSITVTRITVVKGGGHRDEESQDDDAPHSVGNLIAKSKIKLVCKNSCALFP